MAPWVTFVICVTPSPVYDVVLEYISVTSPCVTVVDSVTPSIVVIVVTSVSSFVLTDAPSVVCTLVVGDIRNVVRTLVAVDVSIVVCTLVVGDVRGVVSTFIDVDVSIVVCTLVVGLTQISVCCGVEVGVEQFSIVSRKFWYEYPDKPETNMKIFDTTLCKNIRKCTYWYFIQYININESLCLSKRIYPFFAYVRWRMQGTLTPPDYWFRPIVDWVYLLRPNLFPNFVIFRTLHIEHPKVLPPFFLKFG